VKTPYKLLVLLNKIQEIGCGPISRSGGELRCRCPAHDDNGPSLYIRTTEDRVLVRCSAGCATEEVCDRIDHDVADLFLDADDLWVDPDGDVVTGQDAEDGAHGSDQDAADGGQDDAGGVGGGTPPGPSSSTAPVSVAADEGLRYAVYDKLLGQLEMSTAHFDNLRARGLTADEISKRGYRTADTARSRKAVDELLKEHGADRLLTVPGFTAKDGRVFFGTSTGLLIPVRDLAGRVVALKVRHDGVAQGAKYTWASSRSASCGNVVHVPLGVEPPCATVRLTEGELKADAAFALSGVPTISAPGVTNWALAVPVLKALGAQKVLLAFDQDGKAGTFAAMEKALYGLTREGFEVALEWWDKAIGKGIDDLLATGGQPEVVTGLAAAVRVRDAATPPEVPQEEDDDPEPPPLPLDVFPPALAAYLTEVGESTGTPPDFAALTLLATAGAAVGNSRALCLKPSVWYEAPRFYGANVGDPASGKTPAMDAVVKPYQALQLKLLKEHRDARAAFEEARGAREQALKENRALPEDQRQPLPDVPPEPPSPERFIAMDATVESLAPLLEKSPRGLLMPQDEIVGWTRSMGQYKGGRGSDRQFWLSSWSGKAHLVDRKSQGQVPTSIPRPFINVVGGLPPDMLNELADLKGRNDGFLHRILFVFPRTSAGGDWSEVTVGEGSRAAWEKALTGLRQLAMVELDDGFLGYKVVHLSPAAKAAWVGWYNAHAAETRGPDLPAQLIGPWGKLKSYAARLALLLHCLWFVQGDGDEGEVQPASVERAARLITYFKGHLRLVYGRLRQTPEDSHLLEVLDWVRQQKGGQCTARALVKAKKVTPTAKAKKMMSELQERGYGRLEWRDGGNRRKVLWFVFDPG
jgi:hypothetical protein